MPLFKRKEKKQAAPSAQQGIEKINSTISVAMKKQEYLEHQMNELTAQIKEKLHKGDREGAKGLLRRKKLMEGQLKTVQGSVMNLERQQMALDGATFNKEILDTMRTGNDAMKTAMGGMDADAVADLMDDMQEQQDLMEEINQAMMGDFDAVNDEIGAELDELETQLQDAALLNDGMEKVHSAPATTIVEPKVAAPAASSAKRQAEELASFFG